MTEAEIRAAERAKIVQQVKADFAWAIDRWKDRMTPAELAQTLVEAPSFLALVESAAIERGDHEERDRPGTDGEHAP